MEGLADIPPHVRADQVVDFDVYAPEGFERDFHGAWYRLHVPGVPDMVWTPRNGGHWIATRGPLIETLYADHEHFSSRVRMVPRALYENVRMIPETLDPPEHRPYRQLLNGALAPSRVMRLEPVIRGLATALVEGVAPRGGCEFVDEIAHIFPVHIFLGLCELPLQDADALRRIAGHVTRPDGTMTPAEGYQALRDYLVPFVAERRRDQGQDLLSAIVNGDLGAKPIGVDEGLAMAAQVLLGGLDTVANMLGFVQLFLARDAGAQQALAAEPTLIPRAVEELLRRYAMLFLGREVTRDMDFHGTILKRGDMVIMPTQLHGADEGENDRPLAVDFRRETVSHCTFGRGSHRCPGAHLARLEMRILIEEWLRLIPDFRIAGDAPIRFEAGIMGSVSRLPLAWAWAAR